jgi:hypothetical protein
MEINYLLVNWKLSKLYGRTPHEVTFSMTGRQAKLSHLIARIVRLIGFGGNSTLENNRQTAANLKRARVRSPKNSARGVICWNAAWLKIIIQIHVVCFWFSWRRHSHQQSDRIHKNEMIWDTGGGDGGVLEAKTDRLTVSYTVIWKWTKDLRVHDFRLPLRCTVHEIFRDIRRHRLVITDVCSWTALPLKTGPIRCPETSANN